jgi:predicted RNase H-like HicB family nuclease
MGIQKGNPTIKLKSDAVAVKIVVVRHERGFIAYPLDGQVVGAVVGEGNTYEEAYKDLSSALNAHVEKFGPEVLQADFPVLEAFIAEHLVFVKPR